MANRVTSEDVKFTLLEVSSKYGSKFVAPGKAIKEMIILNTRKAPLDQTKVRQALLTAIDRNYLLQNVFLGTGQVGRSSIDTRLSWAYNPAVDYEKLYAYDAKRTAGLR